ncbi:MAG: hypothetical protein IRZ29_07640 [Thermoflavifilum sp.]|nr:hypothetical protein [Thermoflavifilum sp.]
MKTAKYPYRMVLEDEHKLEYAGQQWHTKEYLLTAPVQGPLAERIQEERLRFGQVYRHLALATDIQIWLIHFWQWETQEKRFVAYFRAIAAQQAALVLELDGFGFIPSHSIILNIRNKSTVADLVKSFRPMQKWLKSLATKPHFITDPYVLFASRLKAWQYEKALPEYQQKSCTGRCLLQELWLWKKDSQAKAFRLITRFPLQTAGEKIAQGLFD